MIKIVLYILFSLLVLAVPSGAAELETYRGPEITVRYEAPLSAPAKRIVSAYKKARTDIETKLGWRLRSHPVIVLIGDNHAFQESARNALVTAFAMPERNLIVIDYSRMNRVPFDLEDTVRHELSHILLHQQVTSVLLPKWFDEGVAQWASGGMSDILRTGENDLLRQAVLSRRLIPMAEISTIFPQTATGLTLAYEQSRSFVEFIVQQYGEEKLRALLYGLERQQTIEQTVHENLGVSLALLEQMWKKSLSKKSLWIAYIADHMFWVLFFLAALITIAGFCVVKRRMKNYRDEEETDEVEANDTRQTD